LKLHLIGVVGSHITQDLAERIKWLHSLWKTSGAVQFHSHNPRTQDVKTAGPAIRFHVLSLGPMPGTWLQQNIMFASTT
jgi:uncharacterized pyridoxal phosphate-containing UPF0001 family protein